MQKVDKHRVAHIAHFLSRLKAVKDGDRDLLHNSTVHYGSGMGQTHEGTELPNLLIGHGGGGVRVATLRLGTASAGFTGAGARDLDALGALGKAKAKTQKTTCLGNLRQVSLAARLFVDDNEVDFLHPQDVLEVEQSRHDGSANFAFADGSTRALKRGECFMPRNLWAVTPQGRAQPINF